MIEFIFGVLFGVWTAQQFPLPSVQKYIQQWWQPSITEEENSDNDETIPIFTGEIPTQSPSV
jgi:hypothetical protein